MVGQERPSITRGKGFPGDEAQAANQILSIKIVIKNVPTLDSPTNNVMKSIRGIYSGFSEHMTPISHRIKKDEPIFMTVPYSSLTACLTIRLVTLARLFLP